MKNHIEICPLVISRRLRTDTLLILKYIIITLHVTKLWKVKTKIYSNLDPTYGKKKKRKEEKTAASDHG